MYALSCLSAVSVGQHVMCCQTCCRATCCTASQAADCPAQPDVACPQDCLPWVPSVLHRLPPLQAPLHGRTGALALQASGGAQLPYLWSPSVVHAEGKGESYLDDFGSHPGMEKRSYAPGTWEAEAGSQDRAAHTDASRWGPCRLAACVGLGRLMRAASRKAALLALPTRHSLMPCTCKKVLPARWPLPVSL